MPRVTIAALVRYSPTFVVSFSDNTVALVFHGIGTTTYGERDYWPDGSFVTTEWFAIAWVPLVPIISKRISYTQNSDYATYDSGGYWVYEMLPLDKRQVLSIYGWLIGVVAPLVLWSYFQDRMAKAVGDDDRATGIVLLATALILALPYVLRRRAKRRKAEEWRRQRLGLPPVDI